MYSSSDNSYKVQSQSGFGCHRLNSRIGFDAKADGTQTFGKGWARIASWDTTPKKNTGLYSLGGGVAKNGYYTVTQTGYYVCNALVRMDLASKSSYFRLNIAINGDRSQRGGTLARTCTTWVRIQIVEKSLALTHAQALTLCKATRAPKITDLCASVITLSCRIVFVETKFQLAVCAHVDALSRACRFVAGTMKLTKGETVSVWVYSQVRPHPHRSFLEPLLPLCLVVY